METSNHAIIWIENKNEAKKHWKRNWAYIRIPALEKRTTTSNGKRIPWIKGNKDIWIASIVPNKFIKEEREGKEKKVIRKVENILKIPGRLGCAKGVCFKKTNSGGGVGDKE